MFEPSTLRRIAVRAVVVLAGVVTVSSVAMPSAFADNVYLSALDVTPPSAGSIDSVDGNVNQIHCGPDAPGPCTITDQQTELGSRPTTGWYTYQLQASNGPAGYSWRWTSGCIGLTPTCAITNDQEYTTVSGEWVDTEGPVVQTLHVPGYARNPVEIYAAAVDNSGAVDHYNWRLCPEWVAPCSDVYDIADTPTGLWSIPPMSDAPWRVEVRPVDAAGNVGAVSEGTVVIDNVAPVLTVTSPREHATFDSFAPAVRFTATDANLMDVRCSVDGGEQGDCADGWTPPFLDSGEHTVAVQARDEAGNQVTVTRDFAVVDPQVTLVGTAESVYGQPARIAVQVPKHTDGLVEFDDASTGLPMCTKTATATGKVSCAFGGKHFRPGAHDVFVRFTGDAAHKMAGATFHYMVDRMPTTMAATAQNGRYAAAYSVQVTGLPDHATGDVEFRTGDTLLCTAHVRDSAASCAVGTRKLEPGGYPVTAAYLGDEMYAPGSRSFRLVVVKGIVTMSATNSDVPAIGAGGSVTLTGRDLPSNATGSVVFTSNGITLCTAKVRQGVASCDTGAALPVGTYNTLATYSGDVHYLKATARTVFAVGVYP